MASARSAHLGLRLRDLGTFNTAYFGFAIDVCCATWSDHAFASQTQSPLARLVAAYPAPGSRRHSFTKGAAVFPEGILRRSVGKAYRRPVEFLRAELPYRAKAEKVQITGRNGYGKSYIRGPMWAEAFRSAPRKYAAYLINCPTVTRARPTARRARCV